MNMSTSILLLFLTLGFVSLHVSAQDAGTYREFDVTLTFTGVAPSKCGKSQRVRLRKTIKNGLNYYGNKEMQTPPCESVEFNFDMTGTKVDGESRQLTKSTKITTLSHDRRLGWVFKARGSFECGTYCPVDALENRERHLATGGNSQSVVGNRIGTGGQDFEQYMSENLTNDVQHWIQAMNKNEGRISCLGTGIDVFVTFKLL